MIMCFFLSFLSCNYTLKVEKCVSKLEHIIKGDIVTAKGLDSVSLSESADPEDSDGSHKSSSTVHSSGRYAHSKHVKRQEWTSLQAAEAKAILRDFLRIKTVKCRKCKAKNPSISKPVFGWLEMVRFFISSQLGTFLNVGKLKISFYVILFSYP